MRLSRLGAAVAACLLTPSIVAVGQAAQAAEVLTVTPTAALGPYAVGASPTASFTIAPNPAGSSVHLEWTLRSGTAETDPVQASGSADAVPDVDGVVSMTFGIPSSLGQGTFGLEVVASDDVPGTGPATGSSGILPLQVVNPPTVAVRSSVPAVFPAGDNYRDSVDLRVTASEPGQMVLELVTAMGQVQRTWSPAAIAPGSPVKLTWDGRTKAGSILLAGIYTVRATVTTTAGIAGTASTPLEVSRARTKYIWTSLKYLPTATTYDKFVGRCSKLVTPSSHGGSGSQGYYSLSKCRRATNNGDVVIGLHSGYLPKAFQNTYGDLRIRLYGGIAKRQRSGYLVLGYYRASDNKFLSRVQLTPRTQWHLGDQTRARPFVRYTTGGRPFVIWSTGLAEGSKYDVQEFRVAVVRKVLRNPDGTLVWPADSRRVTAGSAPPTRPSPPWIGGVPRRSFG